MSQDDTIGYGAALIGAAAMAATAYFAIPEVAIPGIETSGLCLPGPSEWGFPVWLSALCNLLVIYFVTVSCRRLNTVFHLEPGTQTTAAAFFVFSLCSLPELTVRLNSGVLLAGVVAISMWLLFGHHESRDKPRALFLVFSTMAWGAAFNMGFLFMAIPVVIGAGVLKELYPRSVIGALMGAATPFLILLGLNIIGVNAFVMPEFKNPFAQDFSSLVELPELLAGFFAVIASVVLLLRESMITSRRNSSSIAYNRVINIILIFAIVLMGLDYTNFSAYLPTVLMCLGFKLAEPMGERRFKVKAFLVLLFAAVFGSVFAISLTN